MSRKKIVSCILLKSLMFFLLNFTLKLCHLNLTYCKKTRQCNTEDLLIFHLESSFVPVFFSSVTAVFDKGQPLVYTFIPSFIPNMILLKGFHIHMSH